MRLNKFLASHTTLSRRNADVAIANGRVHVNGVVAGMGAVVAENDQVSLDGKPVVTASEESTVILLNKPVGYVCSKNGQGSRTVYDLLPKKYADYMIAGRLDKDSSGLVLLSNNGNLVNELTHPSNKKHKEYIVESDPPLSKAALKAFRSGVDIGEKRLAYCYSITETTPATYKIVLEEGRNRQIRRMFTACDSTVIRLHRQKIGDYALGDIKPRAFREVVL